ncbi:hypothetical protein QRX50_46795 [Amycolatopsis carbonis]|uniref:Nitrogen fixation protein NifE n=1 Tax=Amycolatopsis carbonis TaxID=715471 RepID=A0A9Y2MXF1_9PSEU|nr:hypothetical protein [Amycolatopsis sp. 2-15]WIX78762.1 hypothetical protein QRX50_46795 [Amycolatopsis sp. 2-15]
MSTDRIFDDLRGDPDPLRRGRRATELLTEYAQLTAELARIRRQAIDAAHDDLHLSYTDIAPQIGLTKGRLSQVLKTAPAAERLFFGHGPVGIGVPFRYQTTDRERPLIAAEDAEAADEIAELLSSMMFVTTRYQVEPDQTALPSGDTVVLCGPKSAPIGACLLATDPALRMVEDGGRWWIEEVASGQRHGSPADDRPAGSGDIAYVARRIRDQRVIVHIAGIHTIGSLGAVHYLTSNLPSLFADIGDAECSLVVRSTLADRRVTASSSLAGPFIW